MPDMVKFLIVFLAILGILMPLLWLWRRFSGPRGSSGQRGRRLGVIDTAAVDVRRRLVLIKRDNVEHLLMIGGPTDIVVESNIGRPPAVARDPRPIPDARPEAARQATAAEAPDWALPLEPMARPVRMVDLDAALPEPPARTAREAMVDSMRAVRSVAAARHGPAMDFDNPPEEVAAPALTPPPGEVHHRPPQAPEPRLEPRRPAAAALAPEAQRPQPAPEPVPQPPLPQSLPPSVEAPEPKRERAAPAAPRPAAAVAPAAVPPSPRPVQPVAAAPAAGNMPPPRPVQPIPAAAASAAAVPPPKPTPSDETNLAEMAQRLEAALRRPTRPEPPPSPPPVRPQPPAGRKPVQPGAAGPAKVSVKSPDAPPPDFKVLSGKGKSEPAMDSLEDEMAKMLGRPGKS
jgi:flagellar biogenesis protein FliO